MRVWPLACLLFGGCAQLAGIDNTSNDGRLAVSLSIERTSVGTAIVRTPQDLSASTATYLVTDPADPALVTPVAATETAPGTWSADIFDATPPVVFDLPDVPGPVFDRQITLATRNLLSSFDVLEHPNPTASALTDTVTINATLEQPFNAAQSFTLFVVGTWTQRTLEPPGLGSLALAPPPFEIQAMASLTGRPHERITIEDTPLILRHTGTTLDGVLEVTPFEQLAANTIMGTFASAPPDLALSATIDQPAATARLGVVRPAITTAPAFSFELRAAPGAALGVAAGPLLLAGSPAVDATMLSGAYGNPFTAKNWPTVLTYTAAGSRTLTPSGETLPVTLAAGMQQLVADPTAGLVLDFPAAVPEQVSIGGQSLSLDNVQLTKPTAPVEITMVVDATNVTAYTLEVRELVPNELGTALVANRTLLALATEPTFTIQPEVFETGKLYSLRVQTIRGLFGDLAGGDLRTRSLPMATAFVDVGILRVVP